MSKKCFLTLDPETELVDFLKQERCDTYYHYTTLETFKKILESKKLRFTRGDSVTLNDSHECVEKGVKELHQRSYIACFTTRFDESIAMWKLYSNGNPNVVRIQISSEIVRKWLNEVSIAMSSCGIPLLIKETERFLSDISYVRLLESLNRIQFTWRDKNCTKTFENGMDKNPCFTSLLKNISWAYEQETRAIIRLPEDVQTKCLYIDVPLSEELISSFEILIGPEFERAKIKSLRKLCSHNNIKVAMSQVYHKVNFKK